MNNTPDDKDPAAITIAAARSRIIDALPRINDAETMSSATALGRVLHAAVRSPIDVPPFRAAAMDGYALRADEAKDASSWLNICGQSLAGHPGPDALAAGCCQRITTGARVPDDADAVVQQENVIVDAHRIQVTKRPEPGLHVRMPGTDGARGTRLLQAGDLLGAAAIALLHAHGIVEVQVQRPLRVALISTGDELRECGDSLGLGQIHDANRPLLRAMLSSPRFVVQDLGIVEDDPAAIERALGDANQADIVISTGGVSVGDADHVRNVVEQQGHVELWKVAMKPGRPLTFGFIRDGQAFFGLPGNPVSAAVTTLMFVMPALRHMLGMRPGQMPSMQVTLLDAVRKLPGRVEFQRGCLHCGEDGCWQVSTTGVQDSHVLTSLHLADCLIELPEHSSGAAKGDTVKVYPTSVFSDSML